jgi:hypothetical protein
MNGLRIDVLACLFPIHFYDPTSHFSEPVSSMFQVPQRLNLPEYAFHSLSQRRRVVKPLPAPREEDLQAAWVSWTGMRKAKIHPGFCKISIITIPKI